MTPRFFQRMPFRRKLTVLVTTGTAIALVIVASAVVVSDFIAVRNIMRNDIVTKAAVTSDSITAALEFRDREVATQSLTALRADPAFLAAAAYLETGELFAHYVRDKPGVATVTVPTRAAPVGQHMEGRRLVQLQPVIQDGDLVGTLYLCYDLSGLYTHLVRQTMIVFGAVAVSFAFALLLTRRLQRMVVEPVRHLAETARHVTTDRDYARRARKFSEDEMGELTESFNQMLSEIQARDLELQQHRAALESKVRARTRDLEEARLQAEAANASKSEFLANMSHEIRTPMTAILGYADILYAEGDLAQAPKQRIDALETIRRNGEHLLKIINNILDLSKLEVGKMTVEHAPCSPVQIAHDVVTLMRVRADAKGLALDLACHAPIPRTIETDPTRLRQILVNLVGNALKFTERGSVRLVVEPIDTSDPAAPRMIFKIIDTGIGMKPEQIRDLFQPFTQADTTTTRRFGGTGLGLTISRRFAALLGGSITATSTPGVGSTFTLAVAAGSIEGVEMLERPSQVTTEGLSAPDVVVAYPRQLPAAIAGLHVLLAEDTPDNQRLVAYHLRKGEATFEIVDNGRAVLDVVRAAELEGRPFDVILMDMQMPQMDGYEAVRRLRRGGNRTPIIALTAHAMHGDAKRCREAGMEGYVTKPIDPPALFAAIQEATGRAAPEPAPPATTPAASNGPALDGRGVFDPQAALRRAGGSVEFLAELIDVFLDECRGLMADLRDAVVRADADQVARKAHSLKGSVANFEAAQAVDALKAIEQVAIAGKTPALPAALEQCELTVGALTEALREVRAEIVT